MSSTLIQPLLRTSTRSILRNTQVTRAFGASAFVMAEGATGGTRSGGAAQADAFTKREAASEELFIREQEREKLRAVKEKIEQQHKNLRELDNFIDELTEDNKGPKKGGEKEDK